MAASPTQIEPTATPSSARPEIIQLHPKSAERLWPIVGPILKPAVDRVRGWDMEDTYKWVMEGRWQLWLIVQPPLGVRAVVCTELREFPGWKFCTVKMCAGEGMNEWKHVLEDIEAWARENGCSQVRIEGRKGWERIYPEYVETHRTLVKEL